MRYTYLHFYDLWDTLVLVLNGLEGDTPYKVGLRSLGIKQMYKLERILQNMYNSFHDYTGIPPPHEEYVPYPVDITAYAERGPLTSDEEVHEGNIENTHVESVDTFEENDVEVILGPCETSDP